MDVEERGGGVGIGRRLLFNAGETVLGRCSCTFPVITNRQLESTENISLPIVRALRILITYTLLKFFRKTKYVEVST